MALNYRKYISDFQLILSVLISTSQLFSLFLFTDKISSFFWLYPYWIVGIIWILSIVVIFIPIYTKETLLSDLHGSPIITKKPKISFKLKIAIISINTLIALFSFLYVHKKLKPEDGPITKPPYSSLFNSVKAATLNHASLNNTVKIRWTLVENYSTLRSSQDDDNNLTIEPDNEITPKLIYKKGKREDNPNDYYFDKIYFWLKKRCREKNQRQYLYFLGNTKYDVNLISLTFEHPDLVNNLCPSISEFNKMSPDSQLIIRRWFTNYIGQWKAKICITIDNSLGSKDLQIFKFIYDISEISVFKSGNDTIKIPHQVFSFDIPFKTGRFEFRFTSQGDEVSVHKGKVRYIDIILSPDEKCPISPSWKGDASLATNVGIIKIGHLNFRTFNPYLWKGKK
ncbi:MAG: hypothetical protein Q8928_16725 [Bacteroidota bacterium]|nr:hypothetical protein [Bacteroidota bacterium]